MDISLIKKLREATGAGMLDCKKAMEATHGDYDQALLFISLNYEKPNVSERVASKGICNIVLESNQAILYEINAETDFVSKNNYFRQMVDEIGEVLITSNVTNAHDALKVNMKDMTIDQRIKQTSMIIKENAYLRRLYRVTKTDDACFGSYIHQGGKVVTLVILDKTNIELAHQLALQVAANQPTYLDLANIDQDTMNYEQFMFEKTQGIYEEEAFKNHLRSITLLTQPFIKNPSVSVKEILELEHIKIIDFYRFELGQGIENKLNCKLDISPDGTKITVTPEF